MLLHDLLKLRLSLAKSATKPFHDRVKRELKAYELPDLSAEELSTLNLDTIADRRYFFPQHLILTYHDSMLSSFFDRDPELIFTHRGRLDKEKEQILVAVYEYLKDVMDVDKVMWDIAWWYLLTGFVFALPTYAKDGSFTKTKDNHEVMAYRIDDPQIEVPDPTTVYYAPDAKPGKIEYFIIEKRLRVEDVKRIYNPSQKVEADMSVALDADVSVETNSAQEDLDRVTVYCYYGILPEAVKNQVKGWTPTTTYVVSFTPTLVLSKDSFDVPGVRPGYDAQYYHAPTQFFGFGLAKLLTPLQREKSFRRGQMARYADVAAYPKIIMDSATDVDKSALRDPREEVVLVYTGQPPQYLQPAALAPIVFESANLADADAQSVTGLPSLSTGAQSSSVVKTATGQSIFAEAASLRARQAKKAFLRLYRDLMIAAMKQAQANWDTIKELSLRDENGEEVSVSVDRSMLRDINFDLDVDIDTETPSVNKDVLRAQAIELYNMSKDDPLMNRKKLITHMLKIAFNEKNPEAFLKDAAVPAGTTLVDEHGNQYKVDEDGTIVSAQTQMELGKPTPGSSMPTEAADLGSVYQ